MLISTAMAQTTEVQQAAATSAAWEAFGLNILMVLVMVALFYILMIAPQQKRFKKHREMMNKLEKGDQVLTAAGFLATVHDPGEEGKDEIVLDLGDGVKVTALRSTIHRRVSDEDETPKREPQPGVDSEKSTDKKKS